MCSFTHNHLANNELQNYRITRVFATESKVGYKYSNYKRVLVKYFDNNYTPISLKLFAQRAWYR